MEKRVIDWCVTLMKQGKAYGKKHLLSECGNTDEFGNRFTECGIVIKDKWFVYKSNMSEKTWFFQGCKRCEASRYPNVQ